MLKIKSNCLVNVIGLKQKQLDFEGAFHLYHLFIKAIDNKAKVIIIDLESLDYITREGDLFLKLFHEEAKQFQIELFICFGAKF